jgi:hypothetical protein
MGASCDIGALRTPLYGARRSNHNSDRRCSDFGKVRTHGTGTRRFLTNPVYDGAYAYGKTFSEPRYEGPGPRRGIRRKPREEWLALHPGAHEGYVDWPRAEAIRKMIAGNLSGTEQTGAAKRGVALLAGLIRCRRCGHKMSVHYTGRDHDIPSLCMPTRLARQRRATLHRVRRPSRR